MATKVQLLFLLTALFAPACSNAHEPNFENFTRGMNVYLEKRGALCLGKNSWPLVVSDREAAAGQRDGLQMPVLERLGLVSSSAVTVESQTEDGVVTEPGRSYQLTDAGRRYYVVQRSPARDGAARQQGDFCPVKLSLDNIARFELDAEAARAEHAVVSYRYRVSAPDWMKDAEAQRVFPAVAQVIAGASKAELKEGFTKTAAGWIANDVVAENPAAAPKAGERVAERP